MTSDVPSTSPAFSLLLDPSLKRARDLRLLAGVLCLIAALGSIAVGFSYRSHVCFAVASAAVGVVLLVRRRRWARQAARAEECARDAVPQIATVVKEMRGLRGLRRVTLRTDGADAASDFTWLLPASWGDVVRLDREGRRVAVLSPAAAPERCVPLLRSGRPFVLPDYVASALIALVAEDIPAELRHPDIADLAGAAAGTMPPPPPLPVTLTPAPITRFVWWALVAATPALVVAAVWLAGTGGDTLGVISVFVFPGLLIAIAVVQRSRTVAAAFSAEAIDLRGPLAWLRGSQRVSWDDIGSVSLRWSSRASRQQAETHSLRSLAVSVVLQAVTGVDIAIIRTEIFDVGDAAARLLRGDIIPELDTLAISLCSHSGSRLATYETRTAFQPVRAVLAACAERNIHVESMQVTPLD